MLYITTRNKTDSVTARRTLVDERAFDGGLYIPLKLPHFSDEQLENLCTRPVSEIIAHTVNLFFDTKLSSWDVECTIGKVPYVVAEHSQKILFVQLWNNSIGSFDRICECIADLIYDEKSAPTNWMKIVMRIALLFAIYSTIHTGGTKQFDVSVEVGDFSAPIAVWYAKQMGMPVRRIICAELERSVAWDLFYHGQMSISSSETDGAIPEAERLIYSLLGIENAKLFANSIQGQGVFRVAPTSLEDLSKGFFVSVVGNERIDFIIGNVYTASAYILDPVTALCYAGVQDYRTKSGEIFPTIILSAESPLNYTKNIMQAASVHQTDILKFTKKQ